jgi:hypothetical protein
MTSNNLVKQESDPIFELNKANSYVSETSEPM